MWAEFLFGTILAVCGFLVKRVLDNIDSGQVEMNRRLYHQGERLRALEKNQALEAQALRSIQKSVSHVENSVRAVDKKVQGYQDEVELRVKTIESLQRQNQESLGKIIIIMKKAILKK